MDSIRICGGVSGTVVFRYLSELIKYVPQGSILKMRKLAKMFERGSIEILI